MNKDGYDWSHWDVSEIPDWVFYDRDDDQLIEEYDNEVVEEVEEEWGAWGRDGERPVPNELA